MGYSHYWNCINEPTDEQWATICSSFTRLVKEGQMLALLHHTSFPKICVEYDHDAPPEINDRYIRFNGYGDAGYETMYLERAIGRRGLCKTRQNPYDLVVTALLILVFYHAPDCYHIRSDGDTEDWQAGLELVQHLYPEAKIPIF
jgi:hypothetical protein